MLSNLWINKVPFSPCVGCLVHAGFSDSWVSIKGNIMSTLINAITVYPGFSIIITGHSLGAAVATLAAGDLRTQGFQLSLVSFMTRVLKPTDILVVHIRLSDGRQSGFRGFCDQTREQLQSHPRDRPSTEAARLPARILSHELRVLDHICGGCISDQQERQSKQWGHQLLWKSRNVDL